MKQSLDFNILAQPTETTCGPACLHAVYNYFGDNISLDQVVQEVKYLDEGGTLAVFLACHALNRGYTATIYTYNLNIFDPTWFADDGPDIQERLKAQMSAKDIPKLHVATEGFLEFLQLGGKLRLKDLTKALIRKYLNRAAPILTGLSSTYLYQSPRESGQMNDWDDIKGEPAGHFVVLNGYNREERTVMVADPFLANPYSDSHHYMISIDRVLCSVLLGVLTYDANLLIIEPKKAK
ncbi:MAG: C39 family peptidase [Thermodesulfovibrionia bacterium]|nr:C39 family peptidase [Thermodesulfovibrionia bacterium]